MHGIAIVIVDKFLYLRKQNRLMLKDVYPMFNSFYSFNFKDRITLSTGFNHVIKTVMYHSSDEIPGDRVRHCDVINDVLFLSYLQPMT